MKKKNVYIHEIDLEELSVRNAPRAMFRAKLERIKYRGYEVEKISDGRKIVITKPGGKRVFGKVKIEDFMVWIFSPRDNSLWRISHEEILEDLKAKGQKDSGETLKIIGSLEKVYNGAEPDEVLPGITNPGGIEPEILLKAYKWIWGQEDVNYPDKLGRRMSFEGLKIEGKEEVKTNEGIVDLKKVLSKNKK